MTDEFRELDKAQDEYRERFGDSFPYGFMFRGTFAEAVAKIHECIEQGKPYDPYEGIPEWKRRYIEF